MKKISYILSADIIRVLAVSGVVMIHTADSVFLRLDFFGGISWWVAIILDSIARASVPLFIMLSGFLLLSKTENFGDSLKRACMRIGIPLLVWFFIYAIWNDGSPSFATINLSFITRLFSVGVYHLYFLAIVLGLYIAAPFLRSYLHAASLVSQKNVMYFLLGFGALMTILQHLFLQCGGGNIFNYWLPYTGLFVAGYVLRNPFGQKGKLLGVYILGLVITVGGYYYQFFLLKQGAILPCSVGYVDHHLNIPITMMSFSAFTLLIQSKFDWVHTRLRQVIYSLARASFGIFLIHLMVVQLLSGYIRFIGYFSPAWLFLFINWFVVLVISYMLTLILMRIPYVRLIIGEK